MVRIRVNILTAMKKTKVRKVSGGRGKLGYC